MGRISRAKFINHSRLSGVTLEIKWIMSPGA